MSDLRGVGLERFHCISTMPYWKIHLHTLVQIIYYTYTRLGLLDFVCI